MGPITLIRTTQGVVACPVDAAPLPEIVWKKDGQRIAYDSRVKLADNNRDLLINNVSNADEGEYTCNAENRLGEVEGSSRVRVGGKKFRLITMLKIVGTLKWFTDEKCAFLYLK